MNFRNEINTYLSSSAPAIYRLIGYNVLIYLVFGILNLILFLSGSTGISSISTYFMLPASFSNLMYQPWSIVTYLFLHENFFHILFNMLWLYWIGGILQEYLGSRKVTEAYFAGGIFGGFIYLLAYLLIPVLHQNTEHVFALGASASVLAIVFATATLLPDFGIQLLFFGNVKLKWLALITVALDLISIPNGNAGGHIAHIGGAIAGFLYIKFLYRRGGHLVPDSFLNMFSPGTKLKVVKNDGKTSSATYSSKPSQQEIDHILDKISKTGYDSLSKKEKETLFKASKD